jgi:hypothetical protein
MIFFVRERLSLHMTMLALLCFGFSLPLKALELKKNFYLTSSVDHDSNIFMADQGKDVMRFTVVPRLTLLAEDDQNSLRFDGSMFFARSSDERISVDRNDPTADVGWVRTFERGQFSMLALYQKSSIRASELDRSGVVFADDTSINRSINANFDYFLSDKFTIGTGLGYQKQTFTGLALASFESKMFNATLNHFYTEKINPFYQVSINHFETIDTNLSSVSKNFIAGTRYLVNPRLTLMASVGVNNINTVGRSWIGESEINYAISDSSNLIASLDRRVSAGGLGGFQKSDALALSYNRDLSQRDHIGTSYSWTINRTINDVRFMQFSAWYMRDISNDWSLRLTAQRRNLKSSFQDADANNLNLSIIYNRLDF